MIVSQLASSLHPVFKNLWVHGSYANIEDLYQINFLHKSVKSGSVLVDMDMNIDLGKSLEMQFLPGSATQATRNNIRIIGFKTYPYL